MNTETKTLKPLMGAPAVAIIARTMPSNQHIAVTLRPNDDPVGDSTHTIAVTGKTQADIQKWLAGCKEAVAADYVALHKANDWITSLV